MRETRCTPIHVIVVAAASLISVAAAGWQAGLWLYDLWTAKLNEQETPP